MGLIVCPGAPEPLSLASAFANAGFSVTFLTLPALLDEQNGLLESLAGLGITGPTGYLNDRAGVRVSVLPLLAPSPLYRLRAFLSRRHVFSLGCGDLGCTLLFELGAVDAEEEGGGLSPRFPHRDPLPWAQIQTEPSVSGLYESRWMTIHIPQGQRSHFLAPLRGLTVPAWIQGYAPGLAFRRSGLEATLDQRGQIAARLRRAPDDALEAEGEDPPYPDALTDASDVTAVCSSNGRHLALAFDPSLTTHPWQWPYVPTELKGLQTSPWALCFQCLYLNSIKSSSLSG